MTGARQELIDRGLRIQLLAERTGSVAERAAAEQRCCAFFDFSMRLIGDDLQLEVRAPADVASQLAEIFGPLPGHPVTEHGQALRPRRHRRTT